MLTTIQGLFNHFLMVLLLRHLSNPPYWILADLQGCGKHTHLILLEEVYTNPKQQRNMILNILLQQLTGNNIHISAHNPLYDITAAILDLCR